MKTLISPNLTTNPWKPRFPCSVFLFNFPSLSRENRNLFAISRRKWPCRPGGVLRLSFVGANCVSESESYGGWDNLVLVGDSDRSGEAQSNQFRNFLVSIGVDDKKHIFSLILGLSCALAISRVRFSSIVVFPASVLVFAAGFSFGLFRGGGIGELNSSGNKTRVKDENFKVYVEKFRNLVEYLDDFDSKVGNLKSRIKKAIDSREITVSDLEDYTKVLESISFSASNVRNVIQVSTENLGSVISAENQKSNKRRKELGEIGYDFFQSIGGLFKENLIDLKPTKVKTNVKRGTMDDDQNRDNNLVPSVEETVLNPVNSNKPRANSVQDSSNELPLVEDGYGRIRNGKMSWEEISRYGNRINYSKEYGYENKRLQSMNNHPMSSKMGRDNQVDTWVSNDNFLESVNFSVRMKHTETEASFMRERKLEKSDDIYRSSHISEESEYSSNGSPLREDGVNGEDDSHVGDQLPGHESEMPSPSSSVVSDDVVFDRYLTEANDLLQQAKEFMRDGREKDRAEVMLYKSAKLLSNAIAMKPASLLAVGQLGNTYLLHGELKLRISRDLRSILYRSSPSSLGKWNRLHDQMGSKGEITSALINVCEECEELLVEAGRKYRMALSIDGNDVRALYNWGLALSFRAQLIADIGPEAAFDADKVFMAAIDKFNAMMSKGNVYAPDALFRWGMVLQQRSRLRPSKSKEKVKLLQQAKRLYEDALGMDSNNVQLREALSTCISELGSSSSRSSVRLFPQSVTLLKMNNNDLEAQSENIDSEATIDVDIKFQEDVVDLTCVGGQKPLKVKKLKSKVWKSFDILPLGPDKKLRSACKKCGKQYLADSHYGTGNMLKHIKSCPRSNTRDIGQMLISRDSHLSFGSCSFDSEKWRELVTACIIMHDLPFQFVEYKGLRTMLQYLYPDVELVSRNTAKADTLKLYEREKIRIKNMLDACPGRISLTSDLWTSLTTDGYLCLTAHFLDKNWKLHKRILNFCLMPPPHTGIALSEKIFSLVSDWGIEEKLFSITLDNAASNDVSVDALQNQLNLRGLLPFHGEFFHLRCCAHILNLIVQDGLKSIDKSVEKIRDSIKYVKGSQQRKQKFLECVKLVSMRSNKGLSQDVVTRWNSTYLMLESALFYKRVFQHLELSDSNYKNCPNSDDWERVEKISKFLKVFYDATLLFSGTHYPTSSLYFPAIMDCYITLKNAAQGRDEYLNSMAMYMWPKFQKYWSQFSPILGIALVFDPRYKIHFIEFCYNKAFGHNSVELLSLRAKLESLFDEYVLKLDHCDSPSTSKKKEKGKAPYEMEVDESDLLKEFDDVSNDLFYASNQKSQLELYLDEPRMNRSYQLDILSYWKTNQCRFPILAAMARDILCIPVSTVASEAAFSVGGRVLDQYRSSLKHDTVEAIVCTRDWLYGNEDGFKVLHQDMEDRIKNVVDLDIHEEKNVNQASNSGCT